MSQHVSEITTGAVHVAQKVTAGVTYGGSASAVFFGLSANEIAALGGLAVAVVAGVANVWINWHFKRKHYLLAERGTQVVADD